MKIKSGVRLHGVRPETVVAMMVVSSLLGDRFVVTSAIEGKHSRKSKHYTGCAFDVRTHNLDNPLSTRNALAGLLGSDFDVILESDHIHIEWDPKESY